MADGQAQDEQILQRYLGADFKRGVAPVPAELDRATVLDCIGNEVTDTQVIGRMKRLVRLAVYYDLNDAAGTFSDLLSKNESQPDETKRSVLALIALAWIGDDGQRKEAQNYYHSMLRWTPVERFTPWMEQVCDALGPDEGTDHLREWIEKEADSKQSEMDKLEQAGDDVAARGTRLKLLSLKEYLGTRIPRLDRINAARAAIEGKPGRTSRLPELIKYYVDTSTISWSEMSYWCAMKLMRYANADPNLRPKIAAEFMKRAKAYDRHDNSERQYEFDLNRSKALWAAEFFGAEFDEEDRKWLDQRKDGGSYVLVRRPNWWTRPEPGDKSD